MKNKDSNAIGMNRTGTDVSPLLSEQMSTGVAELTAPRMPAGSDEDLAANRIRYMAEADPVGSVPPPGTLKGAVQTGMQMLKGKRPQALIDKLGERLAFERTGTRLYDALISKHEGSTDKALLPSLDILRQYRDEEYKHFIRVADALRQIGADPTAVTPCADVAAVASMGLVQVLSDPRTTFAQSLDAILIAELADNDGWELLIRMTEEAGLTDVATDFRQALAEEQVHLASVRQWMQKLLLDQSNVARSAA